MHKKRRIKKGILVLFLIIVILCVVFALYFLFKDDKVVSKAKTGYVSSDTTEVMIYDLDFNESIKVVRGSKITTYKYKEKKDDAIYIKIKYDDKFYLIDENNLTYNKDEIVKEKNMYVRTYTTIYKDNKTPKILSYVKKGEKLDIISYDKLNKDGTVHMYKIKYGDIEGYVFGKYLVNNSEDSLAVYDENGLMEYMANMGDTLGAGSALNLDYFPRDKEKFKDNIMPDETRTLYINSVAVKDIDSYIEFAKENNINAFVIDIKDNTSPAYNSPIMKEYSSTNYENAVNEYEDYKSYVKKAKDAGIYLIGRITTFKDSYFVVDHPEVAIKNSSGEPFSHNGSYWPSAYNRYVWEFNVSLALEAVKEVGFNEIQFDYVRFPDRTTNLEKSGVINLNNVYEEEKAQAIQAFAMYATDMLHENGAYISIDVFGESASNYVTAYGQFWPAISNVVDVISGMPYPDHFNAHEFGISEVVWTVPYKVLNEWSKNVVSKQEIIPTPAVVRTWIQTYNSVKTPSVVYDASKVSDEIQALYDNGLTGGYMTWNSSSNLEKYKEVSYAFRKVYK